MATDSPPPPAPPAPLKWPNKREDYEIQEVIGTLVLLHSVTDSWAVGGTCRL